MTGAWDKLQALEMNRVNSATMYLELDIFSALVDDQVEARATVHPLERLVDLPGENSRLCQYIFTRLHGDLHICDRNFPFASFGAKLKFNAKHSRIQCHMGTPHTQVRRPISLNVERRIAGQPDSLRDGWKNGGKGHAAQEARSRERTRPMLKRTLNTSARRAVPASALFMGEPSVVL